MLLALSTIFRVSEVCSIFFNSIKLLANKPLISFPSLKSSEMWPLQSNVMQRYKGKRCPVYCLLSYLFVTKERRESGLFSVPRALKKPYKPITSSTLSVGSNLVLQTLGWTHLPFQLIRFGLRRPQGGQTGDSN